jgi:RimJ/RimL family protein N-acetyltransferase
MRISPLPPHHSITHTATVLETARLLMRPPLLEDFEDMAAMWSDPAVVRHVIGQPLTQDEVWARLLRVIGHWTALGFGHWVVREQRSGAFLGEVGFANYRRGIDPLLDAIPEAGWMLTQASQRQGYATEAVRAALRWAGSHWGAQETLCLIAPDNTASLRLADRFAYVREREVVFKGGQTVILRRQASAAL